MKIYFISFHLHLLLSYNNLLCFDFHVKPIYTNFSFLQPKYWYVLCLHFQLLHTENESEYSDMSSTPLLNYPSRICVVFRVISVETWITFGTIRKVTHMEGKLFILVDAYVIDWIQTLNSHSYLHYMALRTHYSSLSVIHIWRIFGGCWVWMLSQPWCQNWAP